MVLPFINNFILASYVKSNSIKFNCKGTCNISFYFLLLIDKHFPPNNKLSSLFNRHTVRVSYSCTENMKSFVDRHNKTILKRNNQQQQLNKVIQSLATVDVLVNALPTENA